MVTEYGVFVLGEAGGVPGECVGFVLLAESPEGGWRLEAHPEGVFRYAVEITDRGEADAHVAALNIARGFMLGAIADLHARRPELAHHELAGAFVVQSVQRQARPPAAAGDPEAAAGDTGGGE